MKLERHPANPIIKRNSTNSWEAGAVLNPNITLCKDGVFRVLYRGVNGLPSEFNTPGRQVSSIGLAESTDGIHFTRYSRPVIEPDQLYEQGYGCEDPRVTEIDGIYYLYSTAVEGTTVSKRIRIALATSCDFRTWEKHGIVGPPVRSKAGALFPKKVDGQYAMLYTLFPDTRRSSIMLARFDSLDEARRPPHELMKENKISSNWRKMLYSKHRTTHFAVLKWVLCQ